MATRKSSGDPRSTQLSVTEIDWKKVNQLFYDENTYQWDPYSFTGLEKRTSAVTNEVVKEFNARHGTNVQPVLSSMPFKN